jgi:hypothetical protein
LDQFLEFILMTHSPRSVRRQLCLALSLSAVFLWGCSGSSADTQASDNAESDTTVQVSSIDTGLSVKTILAANKGVATSEMQHMQLAFKLKVSAGSFIGSSLQGQLSLAGEKQPNGNMAVEGRLIPSSASFKPIADPEAAFTTAFTKQRKALYDAAVADINVLSNTLRIAMKKGAVAGSNNLSPAQKAAQATFNAAFNSRVRKYNLDLSAHYASYRAALASADPTNPSFPKEGYTATGTIDAQGAVKITVDVGLLSKEVHATGKIGPLGNGGGNWTEQSTGNSGTWSVNP